MRKEMLIFGIAASLAVIAAGVLYKERRVIDEHSVRATVVQIGQCNATRCAYLADADGTRYTVVGMPVILGQTVYLTTYFDSRGDYYITDEF